MVPGNFILKPGDNKFPIVFEQGKCSSIWFTCDTSNDKYGAVAAPLQSLRVVVIDGVTGATQDGEHLIMVGRDPKTGLKAVPVKFKNPKTAQQVHVSPGPDGPSDQRIGFVLT